MLTPTTRGRPSRIDRPTELGRDAFGQGHRLLLAVDPLDQDREFIAALAGRDVVGPDRGGQSFGDLDEEAIARRVSERVVDDLEVVHVEEQDRDPGAPST